jgi:hypothetical protein
MPQNHSMHLITRYHHNNLTLNITGHRRQQDNDTCPLKALDLERQAPFSTLNIPETLSSFPFFNLTLPQHILSQHMRIEALSTTNTLCRKYFGNTQPICLVPATFNFMGTLFLTNHIGKYGPSYEVLFDIAIMVALGGFHYKIPQYANKFSQTSLLVGIALGQIMRNAFVTDYTKLEKAKSAVDFALNDIITGAISLQGANLLAKVLTADSNVASLSQTLYRIIDIPLGYTITIMTNAYPVTSLLLTSVALPVRLYTHDFIKDKQPMDIIMVAAGLFLGAIAFGLFPAFRSPDTHITSLNEEQAQALLSRTVGTDPSYGIYNNTDQLPDFYNTSLLHNTTTHGNTSVSSDATQLLGLNF